jgi:hypothetical protein
MLKGFQEFLMGGRGYIYSAYAFSTSLGIYSTAAGTGPMIWNGSAVSGGKGVTAYLLALSYGLDTASTVAGAIGLTGNSGQVAAPTSTTAITAVKCISPIGGPAPACTAYSVGTPTAAGNFFIPTGTVNTGATTVDTIDDNWIHLGGAIQLPVQAWAGVAAGATLTSAVIEVGICWIEIAND